MTIYGDKYKRTKELVEELQYIYEDSRPEYKKLATFNINEGANYVQNMIRDAVSSGTSSLALCNRLLIRMQRILQENPKLRDQLFEINMPIEEIHDKVAAANEHLALLNPYIIERVEYSIEYTKVMYDKSCLDRNV